VVANQLADARQLVVLGDEARVVRHRLDALRVILHAGVRPRVVVHDRDLDEPRVGLNLFDVRHTRDKLFQLESEALPLHQRWFVVDQHRDQSGDRLDHPFELALADRPADSDRLNVE
jgi:hypothetical protein